MLFYFAPKFNTQPITKMEKHLLDSNNTRCEEAYGDSFGFAPCGIERQIVEIVENGGIADGESCLVAYADADGSVYTCFWHNGQIEKAEHAMLNNRLLEEIFAHYLATDYRFRVGDNEMLWHIIAAYGAGETSITVNGANNLTMLPMQVDVSFPMSRKDGCLGMLANWIDYHRLLIDLTMLRLVDHIDAEQCLGLTDCPMLIGGPHPMAPCLLSCYEMMFDDWMSMVNLVRKGNHNF